MSKALICSLLTVTTRGMFCNCRLFAISERLSLYRSAGCCALIPSCPLNCQSCPWFCLSLLFPWLAHRPQGHWHCLAHPLLPLGLEKAELGQPQSLRHSELWPFRKKEGDTRRETEKMFLCHGFTSVPWPLVCPRAPCLSQGLIPGRYFLESLLDFGVFEHINLD